MEVLLRLDPESVDCLFTSPNPPFWTRAKPGYMGSEHDLHEYIGKLTHIFSRAYISLKERGSLWVHSKDTRFTNGCFMMIPESLANRMVAKRMDTSGQMHMVSIQYRRY